MPPRAIFKGTLQIGDVEAPVKFYSAVREERVHFRLLHKTDKVPLSRRLFCSSEDKEVERDEAVKGFEVADGQYVVLEPEEMKEARPETDREIRVKHFVKEDAIDPRRYNRPYYLGPDGAKNTYAMVHRALKETRRIGICAWTMRRRSYYGALRPHGDVLLLVTLRYEHEIMPVDSLELKQRKVKKAELDSAIALVEQMKGTFNPSDYTNEFQQRLMYFIEQRAKGKKPRMKRPKRKKPTKPSELMKTLQKSLEQRG